MDRQEYLSYSPFTIYFMQNVFLVGQTFVSVGFCRNGTVLFTYGQAGMPVLLTIYHLLHAECLLSRTDIRVCRFLLKRNCAFHLWTGRNAGPTHHLPFTSCRMSSIKE